MTCQSTGLECKGGGKCCCKREGDSVCVVDWMMAGFCGITCLFVKEVIDYDTSFASSRCERKAAKQLQTRCTRRQLKLCT